jgi:hypothetical protein
MDTNILEGNVASIIRVGSNVEAISPVPVLCPLYQYHVFLAVYFYTLKMEEQVLPKRCPIYKRMRSRVRRP